MVLIVGGNSRKAGKSSLVEGIIRALPDARWTALKITKHSHGAAADAPPRFQLELDPGRDTDTGRYLRAGAKCSLWMTAGKGQLTSTIPEVRRLIDQSENLIVESTSVVRYIDPDLFLMVVDDSVVEWKESAKRNVLRADAIVLVNSAPEGQSRVNLGGPVRAKIFLASPPEFATGALIAWLREKAPALSGCGNPVHPEE